MSEAAPLLSVEGLSRAFAVAGGRRVAAVSGVSFSLAAGRTLALVGESGSGKTTTARLVLRLLAADSGAVRFDGTDWLALPEDELRRRRREVGVVFQDPATSLNPRLTAERIVSEPLEIHGIGDRAARRARVAELLEAVGLPPSAAGKRPREFSGGQRQRIGVARALATNPRLVVLDEPVSALDVSVRAQILTLLVKLQREAASRPAYLFIGHDLEVVRLLADDVAVMYLGRIVERGPAAEVLERPRHPYTALLLASRPRATPGVPSTVRRAPDGEPPNASAPPPGCPFHPRCAVARAECRAVVPAEVSEGERRHRCLFPLG